jgi:hypothetical protein
MYITGKYNKYTKTFNNCFIFRTFWNISVINFNSFCEMSPRCHGNRKFKPEHVVAKALVQSTFVQSLISLITQNAHEVMG